MARAGKIRALPFDGDEESFSTPLVTTQKAFHELRSSRLRAFSNRALESMHQEEGLRKYIGENQSKLKTLPDTAMNENLRPKSRLSVLERCRGLKQATSSQDWATLAQEIVSSSVNTEKKEKDFQNLLLNVKQLRLPREEKTRLIFQLLDIMRRAGVNVNARHVSAALTVCIDNGAINAAKQIFEAEWAQGNKAAINEFSFAKLIQGYCSLGMYKEAFSLLEVMDEEGIKKDVVIYNTLLECEQNPERASLLLQELKEQGNVANERTYSAAMRCFGRAGELGSVRHLWKQMCFEGVVPSIFTFNSLLDAYANVGDVLSCKDVIREMETTFLKPDRESFNTLLKAYSRSRDTEGAVSVLRHMSRAVMDACVRGGNMLQAIKLSKELILYDLKPDATTFSTLLRASGFLHDAKMVQKMLLDMKRLRCQHNEVTYRSAVYAYVHCGEGGKALEILEEMNAAGFAPAMTVPDVLIKSVDSALFRECTKAAQAGRLHKFLSQLVATGLTPTCETGSAIVRKLAHTHGINLALDVAKELLQAGISPLGLKAWLSLIGASGAQAEQCPMLAAAAVDDVLRMMEAEGTSPNREFFEATIPIYVKSGNGAQAIKMYEAMQSLNLSGGAKGGSDHLIGRMLLETMDAVLLSAITADIQGVDKGRPHTKNSSADNANSEDKMEVIMQDLAEAGIRIKPKAVTRVIQQLCVETPQHSILKARMNVRKPMQRKEKVQENHDSVVEARRVQQLERAMGLVETSACLFGMEVTEFVYGALIEACIKLKQEERVELLWNKMRSEGVSPDLSMWLLRIKAMARCGKIRGRAHELLAEAAGDNLELDMSLLRSLLKACQCHKDKVGVSHVQRMLMMGTRNNTF